MCDGIKTYVLGYWICVMVYKTCVICTRVLDMCDGIKTYPLGYWVCVMVLKRMHSGTGYVMVLKRMHSGTKYV